MVDPFRASTPSLEPVSVDVVGKFPRPGNVTPRTTRTWRFWVILLSLGITNLLTAIEGTIITNTLPTIVAELGGGPLYVWVANAFFLSSIATLPLYGQASDVFGRRWLSILAVSVFTLGGGLSGGATNMTMLIAGRVVQGLGGGGINMLIEIIVTDLVPLRERGKYLSFVMIAAVVGAAAGPFLGGVIVDNTTWRWVFYINLPIGGVSLTLLFLFLHTGYPRGQSMRQRLARIDFIGNLIFIIANTSILIALTWGGAVHPWKSYQVLVPLITGFLGLGLFTAFEWSPNWCPEPSFPKSVVGNRTSGAAMLLTFLHAICTYWAIYYLPIYFQSLRHASPLKSGVYTLPTFVGVVPFAMVGGVILSKTGRYKPIHLVGFTFLTVSYGLFSLLNRDSTPSAWVCFQLVGALGVGLLAAILLPAVQAPLPESLVASSTSVWSFARGFGALFAFTIPSAVFNSESARRAGDISDPVIAAALGGGQAYQYATATFVNSITDETVRGQVLDLFHGALRLVWLVAIAFAGLGFVAVFIEREVKLREELNTEFGLEDRKVDNKKLTRAGGNVAPAITESEMGNTPRDGTMV